MELSCPYKLLPYPVQCDTLLITFSQHYEVLHQQCHNIVDVLPLLDRYKYTHKVVFVADHYDQGKELIQKISELKRTLQFSKDNEDREEELNAFNEEKLGRLMNEMMEGIQKKSSFLHLKCLLNETQQKIQTLVKEVGGGRGLIDRERLVNRNDKRKSKQLKIKQKKLMDLKEKKDKLEKELKQRDDIKQWIQEQKQNQLNYCQQEEEENWLNQRDDSQQEKENLLLF